MALVTIGAFTVANLADKSHPVNTVSGATITDANGDDVVVRDRWDKVAQVYVTDSEVAESTAIWVSESLLQPWVRGGAKLGTDSFSSTSDAGSEFGQTLVDASVILPE